MRARDRKGMHAASGRRDCACTRCGRTGTRCTPAGRTRLRTHSTPHNLSSDAWGTTLLTTLLPGGIARTDQAARELVRACDRAAHAAATDHTDRHAARLMHARARHGLPSDRTTGWISGQLSRKFSMDDCSIKLEDFLFRVFFSRIQVRFMWVYVYSYLYSCLGTTGSTVYCDVFI